MKLNRTQLLPDRPGIPPMAALPEAETLDPAAILGSYRKGEHDLICVLGPTASGKTRWAVELCRKFNGIEGAPVAEIISADSRQVYRGMDIGTGKDLGEYGEIPYHLIDIAPAGYRYNIYQYQRDFSKVWEEIRRRGCIPVMCGGSGLYIEAATRAYKFPKQDCEIIEPLPESTYYIGTLVSREERVERIDARLDSRLEEGLVDEVRGLLASGIEAEDLIYYGLEYKFVTQHVLGLISEEEMKIMLANAIHQFAKRQMTWFRGMERDGITIHWVRP